MRNLVWAALIIIVGGCSHHHMNHHEGESGEHEHSCACGKGKDEALVAKIVGKSGTKTSGVVKVISMKGDTHLSYSIENLKPNQSFGFHIHEVADCSAADAASAKGHWNPGGHKHGDLKSAERHSGDLGNIKSDAKGLAEGEIHLSGVKIEDLKDRAFVVHGGPDDLKTDPSGNSGPRIGCGVF